MIRRLYMKGIPGLKNVPQPDLEIARKTKSKRHLLHRKCMQIFGVKVN